MAGQSTSEGPASAPVKWGLAGGMLILMVLIVGVAVGVLNVGSQNPNPSVRPPGDGPDGMPSYANPSTAGPLHAGLEGTWRARGGLVLTIAADGSYTLTWRSKVLDEGRVGSVGGSVGLTSNAGAEVGDLILTGERLLLKHSSLGYKQFFRVE